MLQPALPARLVDRPALTATLDAAAAHKVVVVKAGPGWGKTTSVAAWAATRRACWLGVGADTSLERLSRGLLRALRQRLPRLPAELITTTAQVDAVASLVCGLLDVHLDEPVVLVVDDAGALAPGSDGARLVEALCLRTPEEFRLVLLTRGELGFALPASVCEINSWQLAFSDQEVAALVGTDAAAVVRERTGGWPAAVTLYRETLPPERFEDGDVLVQLAASALAGESEPTLDLVRTIAMLGRASTALCVALGFTDVRETLPELARRGLLSVENGEDPAWSVLEPIRELFSRYTDDTEFRLRAAVFCERTGAHAEALRHLVEAQRWDLVAQLLLRKDEQIVAGGDADAVLAAVARLEIDDPRLYLVWGFARQHKGDWLGALHCYEQAAEEVLRPRLSWRMGQLHDLTGQTERAVDLFERTVFDEAASLDEVRLLSLAVRWFRETGRHEQARELASRCALAAQRCGGHTAFAWSSKAFGLLAAYDGDRVAGEMHFGQAVDRARRAGNRMLELTIRAERAWFLAAETGAAEALTEVDEVLVLGRQAGLTGHEPHCLTIRALAGARLGRFDEALADAATGQAMWNHLGLVIRAEVHRRRGEPGQAQAFLDEALAMPGTSSLQVFAKATLARILAGEDVAKASRLADEAVVASENLRVWQVPALLARGWVALLAGDRESARADAATARALAGRRRDKAGLADSLQLAAATSADPKALLAEAATVWRAAGDQVGAAAAGLAAARLSGMDVTPFENELRGHGVRFDVPMADVLGTGLPRAARIVVRTLGGFQVLRDGAPVPSALWQSKKARDLLKILAANRGRAVPRPQLVELLWPDDMSDRTANRLSVLLSTVRTVLSVPGLPADAEPLVADRDTVSLDLSLVDLDVAGFLDAAHLALTAHRRGDAAALALLTDADELYLGEFLAEEPYEQWAIQVREEVRGRYTAVLRALVQLVPDPDQQVGYLTRMLELDCYDESAHVRLVHALRAAGRHGEARRRYQVYVEQMNEIGVLPAEPDPFDSRSSGVLRAS
ncbi:BTAD domain-containing putative transcriptional regulator [Lentzea sp. NPDC051213]|uniref:BTAD domain-containing putative transcriptional regulator n=1 Tax=Lentzea sp. NPDC051213 TaxID=3364126 RepID=UPI00378DB13C